MESVQIRITSTVVTAPYGTLMPGTILRTSPAYAKHLVEEAFAANYITTQTENAEPQAKRSKNKQKPKSKDKAP